MFGRCSKRIDLNLHNKKYIRAEASVQRWTYLSSSPGQWSFTPRTLPLHYNTETLWAATEKKEQGTVFEIFKI